MYKFKSLKLSCPNDNKNVSEFYASRVRKINNEFGIVCSSIQDGTFFENYVRFQKIDSKNVKCVFYNIPISFFAYENFFKMIREAAENYFANKLAFADSSEKIYCIQCAQLAFEKELKSKHSNGQKVFDKSLQSRMY